MLKPYKRQGGVSLVELLVGLAVGLVVLSAVGTMLVSIARSATDILGSAKLNHEMRAAMDAITRDIRRAGARNDTPLPDVDRPSNPFTVRPTPTTGPMTDINILDAGQTILMAFDNIWYDSATDSKTAGVIGYRLDGGVIRVKYCALNFTSSGDCNTASVGSAGGWEALTNDQITITKLLFTNTGSFCYNATLPISTTNPVAGLCSADLWPNYRRMLEKRLIRVELEGELTANADFKATHAQNIYVMNDRVVDK